MKMPMSVIALVLPICLLMSCEYNSAQPVAAYPGPPVYQAPPPPVYAAAAPAYPAPAAPAPAYQEPPAPAAPAPAYQEAPTAAPESVPVPTYPATAPAPAGVEPAPAPAPVYQQPAAPAPEPAYQQPVPAPAPAYYQPAPAPAPSYYQPAPNDAAVGTFHDALMPYGQWVYTGTYGWVWRPYGITAGWRPYYYGHWVMTDYGWTFVGDDSWGWACYHYGRWYYDGYYGWLWYPGLEWAPAWVAWRTSDTYVGWCAIPPGLSFTDVGFATSGVRLDLVFPSWGFCFVRFDDFCRSDLRVAVFQPGYNVNILVGTSIFIGLGREHGRIFHRFHDEPRFEERWERDSHHRIERYRLSDRRDPGRAEIAGGEVRVFRPDLNRQQDRDNLRRFATTHHGLSERDIAARQEAERRSLEQGVAARRSAMEAQQRAEASRAGARASDVRNRHDEAMKAFDAQAQRERSQLDNIQGRKHETPPSSNRDRRDKGRGAEAPQAQPPTIEPAHVAAPSPEPTRGRAPGGQTPPVEQARVEPPTAEPRGRLIRPEGPPTRTPEVQPARVEPARVVTPSPEPTRGQVPGVETPTVQQARVETPAAEPSRRRAPRVGAPQNETAQMEQPSVPAPRVDNPQVETPTVESRRARVSRADASAAQRARAEAARAEAARAEAGGAQRARVEQPAVDRPRVEQPAVDRPRVEQPAVDRPRVERTSVERTRVDTPRAAPDAQRGSRGRGEATRLQST